MTTGTAIQLLLPGMESVMPKPACGKLARFVDFVNIGRKRAENIELRPCLREMGHIGRHDPVPRKTATSVDKS